MADMLTLKPGKPIRNDAPGRQERGRGRNAVPVPVQSIGPLLRERREAMGVTLAEAEVATRIRQKYLAALEADEWDLLPGEVVGRGFLRNYTTYLGLEATDMIERRRAVADDSLAAVLVNTSAGSALPPERKVDYRPKDVALKDEGDELEVPRQINWTPFVALLALALVVGLGYWGVTQFGSRVGSQIGEWYAAGQRQVADWTAPQVEPTPRVAATVSSDLTAGGNVNAQTTAVAATAVAAATAAADALAAQGVQAVPPVVVETPVAAAETAPDTGAAQSATAAETAPVSADAATADAATVDTETADTAGSGSLLGLLPTPTPQPPTPTPGPTPAPVPATVNTGANLRSGPGTDYPILAGVGVGQQVTLTGISADGLWYQVSDGSWIFGQLVDNPPANLPVVEAPPLTAAPVEVAAAVVEAAPIDAGPVEAAPVEAAPVEAAPVTP